MAKLHKVPISLEEPEVPFLHQKFYQFINNIPNHWSTAEKQQKYQHLFADINFENDFNRLVKKIESAKNTKIVLCHNDLLIYNVLYDEVEDQIHFIDYEYTGANYQLFDIANHFNEYAGESKIFILLLYYCVFRS